MFLKLGVFILLVVVVTSDCERAPTLPLLPGTYRQIFRSFVPVPKGRSLSLSDVKIAYYRDSVENRTSYRTREIESLLKDKTFVLEKPTVFYIHGYVEYVTDKSVGTVVSAYIRRGGYNVLALDWANLAFGNYFNVLFDIQPVGDEAGRALVKLLKAGLQLQGLHIVGHSMGVQVGAVAARHLAAEGYTVERLTGLDPAYPGFYPPLLTKPISPKDARFVDNIHTAGGQIGSPFSGGHVDFWPNGGKPPQPGCPPKYLPFSDEYFCSHWRSWRYWAESVVGGKFVATKCDSYDAFLKGSCSGRALMGLQATPDLHGDYYLRTAAEEPFALGERDCVEYEYDTSPFGNTIISEWDLVCSRSWLASFTQMVLQFGILIGSVLFGFLSDRYGRKNTFILSVVALVVFGFGIPFSPDYITFTVQRFFLGVATAGTMVISFVIIMEIIGSKYREICGCLFQLPFIVAHMSVPLFAYFYRDWNDYTLALAVPAVAYVLYFFVLSESPRWLISMGKLDEATELVKKAAVMNNLPTSKVEETLKIMAEEIRSKSNETKPNYIDLLHGSLRLKTLCSCYIWLITGLTYFGFNQYISQTSPDPFITVAVVGAIQIPANLLSIWILRYFGRKLAVITFFIMGGICVLTLGIVPDIFWLTLTLGSIGVSCATIVGACIYIYSSEIFPTVVRNMGVGACSTSMRVGSMIAPFISNLSSTVPWLPTVIFGVAAISAALVCLMLPETKGTALPDSLKDTESS